MDDNFSLLLENAELKESEQKDGMTGLFNRKTLDSIMPIMMATSIRENRNCSFMMIDLDYFKKVNDGFGHQKGDETLKRAARVIAATLNRGGDMAFRYGGEEFSIFLPDTDEDGSMIIAEKIKVAIAKEFEDEPHMDLKKTASIGVASLSQLDIVGKTSEELVKEIVKCADDAMYKAKGTGRNRVVCYAPADNYVSADNAEESAMAA